MRFHRRLHTESMMTHKLFVALAIGLALSGQYAVEANAQAVPSRGTVKARPRLFNPFDVSRSRLTVNRFGIVGFASSGQSDPFMLSGSRWEAATAMSLAAAAPAAAATASTAAVASVSSVASGATAPPAEAPPLAAVSSPTATGAGDEGLGIGAAVRPPYRPPVRSPFRPPPRPPF